MNKKFGFFLRSDLRHPPLMIFPYHRYVHYITQRQFRNIQNPLSRTNPLEGYLWLPKLTRNGAMNSLNPQFLPLL